MGKSYFLNNDCCYLVGIYIKSWFTNTPAKIYDVSAPVALTQIERARYGAYCNKIKESAPECFKACFPLGRFWLQLPTLSIWECTLNYFFSCDTLILTGLEFESTKKCFWIKTQRRWPSLIYCKFSIVCIEYKRLGAAPMNEFTESRLEV